MLTGWLRRRRPSRTVALVLGLIVVCGYVYDRWVQDLLADHDPSTHPALFYPHKTPWMAGLNARDEYANTFNLPTVRWTRETEDSFEAIVRELYNPPTREDCERARFVVYRFHRWGFTSALRDQLTVMLAGVFSKRIAHLNECENADPLCPSIYFQAVRSRCAARHDLDVPDAVYPNNNFITAATTLTNSSTQVVYAFLVLHEAIRELLPLDPAELWFWDRLTLKPNSTGANRSITYHDSHSGQQLSFEQVRQRFPPHVIQDLHLSVLRSLMFRIVYRPNLLLQSQINHEVERIRSTMSLPRDQHMAIIHVRRSDKRDDNGTYFSWLSDSLGFYSTAPLATLVRYAEAYLKRPFKSVMLMSDSTAILGSRRTLYAQSFQRGAWVHDFTVNLLGAFYHDHAALNDQAGHLAIPHSHRIESTQRMLVEVFTAGTLGAYLLGSGSCGVSQMIAQVIAVKYHMDPSSIALWEEDLWSVECQRLRGVRGDPIGSFVPRDLHITPEQCPSQYPSLTQ